MPRLDGIETTKRLKERLPDVKTVILSVHEGEEYASRVLRAGACGYLLKNAGRKEIFHALRLVLRGEQYFSPGVSAAIVRGFLRTADGGPAEGGAGAAPTADPARLTARELEVLRYIAQGFTNRQIAEELSLSFRTINTHRTNIMEKLDIHDTAGLVRHAIGLGLISIG
jgi:two-component system response regulator NreC